MEKLELKHIKINKSKVFNSNTKDMWYWVCPICLESICPHEAGKGKGHQVIQSKGVATKHLIAHNAGYVPKKSLDETLSKNTYYCNKCNNTVLTKRQAIYSSSDINWKPEHKFICLECSGFVDLNKGLKTKDEVHKGKIK